MVTRVPDWGDPTSRLVLIGEAPGTNEMQSGRPFVGASGHKLSVWWKTVGLTREDFYITNVLDYQPKAIDAVPQAEFEEAFARLHTTLASLPNVTLIVPTGNYALYALTGKGKVHWHARDGRMTRPGILDWRGSILSVEIGGRLVKVIPTIHPAYILRMPGFERLAMADWQRIAEDATFPDLRVPERTHLIRPSAAEVEAFVHDEILRRPDTPVAVDIETPRKKVTEIAVVGPEGKPVWERNVKRGDERVVRFKSGAKKGQVKMRSVTDAPYIGCIGLGNSATRSLTVPTARDYWPSDEAYARAMGALQLVLLTPRIEIILQNGMFDAGFIRWEWGWPIGGWVWDTRAMSHCLDPLAMHDLATMGSLYTRQPFWKHEAKDPDEATKYASNSDALWTYNGIDVCVTWEVWSVLRERLAAAGRLDFYHRHYASLFPIFLEMLQHGMALDHGLRAQRAAALDVESVTLAERIATAAGIDLVPKKSISNQRLMYYVYGERAFVGEAKQKSFAKLAKTFPDCVPLNIPPRTKQRKAKGVGRTSSVTIDEVTVRRLMLRYPALKTVGELVLEHRRNRKLREFVDDGKVDADGRLRCQYGLYTDAGRPNASETPWRTGRNLLNIDREVRDVYVPDGA